MIITKPRLTLKSPSGFTPVQHYPYRSPISAGEALIPLVRGKVFCDLGCGAGDIAEYLVPYAQKCYGVESRKPLVQLGMNRSFEMIKGDLFKVMPEADVYYSWNKHGTSLRLARMFQDRTATLVIGAKYHESKPFLKTLFDEGAEILQFPINEQVQLSPNSRQKVSDWLNVLWCLAVIHGKKG